MFTSAALASASAATAIRLRTWRARARASASPAASSVGDASVAAETCARARAQPAALAGCAGLLRCSAAAAGVHVVRQLWCAAYPHTGGTVRPARTVTLCPSADRPDPAAPGAQHARQALASV